MLEIMKALIVVVCGIIFMIISVKFNVGKSLMIIYIIMGVLNTFGSYSNALYTENMVLRVMYALSTTEWLLSIMVYAIKLEKLIDREKKDK